VWRAVREQLCRSRPSHPFVQAFEEDRMVWEKTNGPAVMVRFLPVP
jgi:hypothetical protein